MRRRTAWIIVFTAAISVLAGCQTMEQSERTGQSHPQIQYMEIVCLDVDAQCAALEKVHGLSFGTAVADLGQARVAEAPDGSFIAVRAPLADHEQPIIRSYLAVEDIAKAVEEVEAAGGKIAYPPTQQGDYGTFAVYFQGDIQLGLWQRQAEL